jgi:peptidoglycan-recognition protein LB
MLPIVARSDWGARDATLVETFSSPIPFVIIHHSYTPSACYSKTACEAAMRTMQDMHQLKNEWNDIGYSFSVGGDGRIYSGRGYNVIGAHAPRYNDKSVGICLIGDWTSNLCFFSRSKILLSRDCLKMAF